MKPKEKAKELVNKFNEYTVVETIHYPNGKIKEGYTNAKQCALIAVNEILNANPTIIYKMTGIVKRDKYWQEVKQEIEKL